MFNGLKPKITLTDPFQVSAAKVEQFVAHFATNKIVLFTLFKRKLLL